MTNHQYNVTESYLNSCLPESEWGKAHADTGIELNLGYMAGQLGNPTKVILSESAPHMLVAGASGSGYYSIAISTILTAAMRYSPADLQVALFDRTGNEVSYGMSDFYTGRALLPHMAHNVCGECYAVCYSMLRNELNKRAALLNGKKFSAYNAELRAAGKDNKCMPRLLVVMYITGTDTDQSIVKALAKDAKSAGVNIVFVCEPIELDAAFVKAFDTRICLRSNAATSNALLNSDVALGINQPSGFAYFKVTGELPVPYEIFNNNDDDVAAICTKLRAMYPGHGVPVMDLNA